MDPRIIAVCTAQGGVASATELKNAGVSSKEINRVVAKKELVRVRQDALILKSALQDKTSWECRALITRAVGHSLAAATDRESPLGEPGMAGIHALSHQSALIVHGLPYLHDDDLVHLCRLDGGRGRRDRTVFVHKPVDESWVEVVDGMRVVMPVMAALQAAGHSGVEAGVVCLDGVLHRAEMKDLADVGRRNGPARALVQEQIARALEEGFPRADTVVQEVVELADGGAESVGESRSRLLLQTLGFGPVITQYSVRDGALLVGRTDLKLDRWHVIVEFDGQGKYSEGKYGHDSVYKEKRREDQIRDLGYEVVRLVWDDLAHPARVRQKILAAIARAEERARLGA